VVALGNAEGTGAIIPAGGQVTGLDKTITASDEAAADNTETLNGHDPDQRRHRPWRLRWAAEHLRRAGHRHGHRRGQHEYRPAAAGGFTIPIDTALSIGSQIVAGHAISTVSIGYPPFIGIFIGSGTSSTPQTQAQQQEQQNGFGDGTGGLGGYNGYGGSGSSPACYTSNTNLAVPTAIAPAGSGTLMTGPSAAARPPPPG
jgi:hypothetical protein